MTRHHKWAAKQKVPACESRNGCDFSARACDHCQLVKMTVHPPRGLPYRAWWHPGSQVQFLCARTPRCLPGALITEIFDAPETMPAEAAA